MMHCVGFSGLVFLCAMKMFDSFIIQPPQFLRVLFPHSFWRGPHSEKNCEAPTVYLTFDDGPVPEQTPWVLDLLASHGIKGTFFCVGENVHKHPEIFERLVREGHAVGNHTYNHVPLFRKGVTWRGYLENVDKCQEVMEQRPRLFRAPHGHILPWRAWQLTRDRFSHLVFWDVMPMDYDNRLTPNEVAENVMRYVRPGSVIVMHDSIKAGERMRVALTRTIEELKQRGWRFLTIGEE